MRKNIDFILHCGGFAAELEQVRNVDTPDSTKTWFPIPHIDLYNNVADALNSTGLQIVNEQHALSCEGRRYFSVLQVANGESAEDYSLVVGLRNSHDQRFPAGLCVGSGVFVCDNLAFSSEIVFARKHTKYIATDLNNLVHRAVGSLTEHRNLQDNRLGAYKAAALEDKTADAAIIELLRSKVITTTQVGKVVSEWDRPSHPEFGQDQNAWRLFNAVTEVSKGKLFDLPKRSYALHGICDQLAGVTIEGEVVQ